MLLLYDLQKFLVLERLDELVERPPLRTTLLNPILDPLYDNGYDVVRLVFGNVEYGQIHSAPRPLLQLVHEGELPGHEYHRDVLLDVAVEPLEEVVEHPLLPALEGQHVSVFDDQQQLLLPSFLELFV